MIGFSPSRRWQRRDRRRHTFATWCPCRQQPRGESPAGSLPWVFGAARLEGRRHSNRGSCGAVAARSLGGGDCYLGSGSVVAGFPHSVAVRGVDAVGAAIQADRRFGGARAAASRAVSAGTDAGGRSSGWAGGAAGSAGPHRLLSHCTAAGIHGLGIWVDVVELTAIRRIRLSLYEVIVHRGVVSREDWHLVNGLPLTTPARPVADLAAAGTDAGHLASVVRDALTRAWPPWKRWWRRLPRMPQVWSLVLGWAGFPRGADRVCGSVGHHAGGRGPGPQRTPPPR